MKTTLYPFISTLAVAALCWAGATSALGQAITNFTGIWNNVMISTPAQLSVVTRTDARNGTTHVTVTEVQERTQFNAGVMTLAMDGNGNFSGPASGTITVIGPGLVRVTPNGDGPVLLNVNAAQDVAFAAKQMPDSPQQDLELLLKAPTAMTSAELAGTWKLVSFGTPRYLVLHRSTNFSDPGRPIEGIVNIEGREEFRTGGGTMAVAADGSFSLVFGPDNMTGTAAPGANGLLTVTIPMSPNPSMVLSFYVNASKNVMAAVHTEQNYQELIVAVKLPATQADSESQGLWRVGSLETPRTVTLPTNGLGLVRDILEREDFYVSGEQFHIGHTGMFTTPANRGLGRASVLSPGAVQVAGTNDAGQTFLSTFWCNSSKDFLIGTHAETSQEINLVARAPAENLPGGPAEFGLMLAKPTEPPLRVNLHWASAANRVLQVSTNPVNPASWVDLAETLGGHTHAPSLGSLPRAYYRVRQTIP